MTNREADATIYLDYQGSTPVDRRVIDAMQPWWAHNPANPHAGHVMGVLAEGVIEEARSALASLVCASSYRILFTSGATESINLAIRGSIAKTRRLITWTTEHGCTLDVAEGLRRIGNAEVVVLPVESNGLIDLDRLEAVLSEGPALVSCAAVNNEIGVVQDLDAIGGICAYHGSILHVDGAQAVGKIEIDVKRQHIELLSISGHKMYGPKGIGALAVSPDLVPNLSPLLDGAGQQEGLRPGTLPTPLCVGLGEACRICATERESDIAVVTSLQRLMLDELEARLGPMIINGNLEQRWPGNLSLTFPGIEAELLLAALPDLALSMGSACSAGALRPSHVLEAIGLPAEDAACTIRVGFGRMTTKDEIYRAAERIAGEVERLRTPAKSMGVI